MLLKQNLYWASKLNLISWNYSPSELKRDAMSFEDHVYFSNQNVKLKRINEGIRNNIHSTTSYIDNISNFTNVVDKITWHLK